MKVQSLVLALPLLLAACGDFRMDSSDLTARSAATPAAPDCSSCHGYPLTDTNHAYHLFYAGERKEGNGPITCLDCHSTAIAEQPFTFRDTLFVDTDGNQWSSHDFPIVPFSPGKAEEIRFLPIHHVDTVVQQRPIPAPARPGRVPAFQEYITSLAHMNGKVDVVFHPRGLDSARFPGIKAEFNPKQETCSALDCHPNTTPYWRFAAPLKGLRQLEGKVGDDP